MLIKMLHCCLCHVQAQWQHSYKQLTSSIAFGMHVEVTT